MAWSLQGTLKGPIGSTGLTGPTGTTGTTGQTGGQGVTGPTGSSGTAGTIGNTGDQGPAGESGLRGLVGPAGLTWRGAWSAAADPAYAVDDAVSYMGSTYFAADLPGVTEPETTEGDTHWMPLALEGATGQTGSTGGTGPTGPTGVTGDAGETGGAGATGTRGSKWFVGEGDPVALGAGGVAPPIVGAIAGDFYLNSLTGQYYEF